MNEVDEIRNRLDIVDVIGSYIQLKPAGRNFKALSPFRTEKTASFMVSPDKGIWHDFSAGEGGDIFSFVMRMEGITFPEALEMLAKRAGVILQPRSGRVKSDSTKLYAATELAMKYYHLALSKDQAALNYLTKTRALSRETIKRFVIGYAPKSWDDVANYLLKSGFHIDELKKAGLISQKSTAQKPFNIFRDRIMFPIFDNQGRPVGFSARILTPADGSAKYINTAQTPIYDKSSAIYGLAQAKDSIRAVDEAVVVEGNMDVLGLAQAGQQNVVAVSGTALTTQQLKILSRLTKNIKLCFDQDEAGIRATQRAIELGATIDARLSVITFQGAKDPDELVRADKAAWETAVENSRYAPDYLFEYAAKQFPITTADGKKQASNFLLPMVRSIQDEIERDHYVKRLSALLGVSEDSVLKKMGRTTKAIEKVETEQPKTRTDEVQTKKLSRAEQIEEGLLELLLAEVSTRACLAELDIKQISEHFAPIFEVLLNHSSITLDAITKALPDRVNDVKILTFRGEEKYRDLSDHDKRLEAYTQLHRLQKLNLELHKRQLAKQIAQAEAVNDKALSQKLLREYQALIAEE